MLKAKDMEKIKNIGKELEGIYDAIDSNLYELHKYLMIANAHGATVGDDWQVIPSTAVPKETYQQIDLLGHKSMELIRERENKTKELIEACDEEYKNQIRRAGQLDVPGWYIERLKTACSYTSQTSIIRAVENMKTALDGCERFANTNK